MAINFNNLPQTNPNNKVIEPGSYLGTIELAEMRTAKDPAKPPYLNIRYSLKDKETGVAKGSLYDIITESDAEISRFKLFRFMTALGLDTLESFDLKDLPKLIMHKTLELDISVQKSEGYPDKNVVDVFTNDIFRPVENNTQNGDTLFNAEDAEDAENTESESDNLDY